MDAQRWIVILLCVLSTGLAEKSWWQTASFYQIYPRSFKDSNGDGVGDLNGVTSKLAYLKEIGIAGTWLSPFLKSPMADFGYDISNFTEIDPLFGNMNDFENMVAKAKELGIRIILDFVPNHSSDECEWFVKSAARDPEFKDFYVWHPGRLVNGTRKPPSNWMSVFRGSAWEWHEGRGEYYLHQFHKKQPDFNFRNSKVRATMNEILRFWLDKGVHGFRIDAAMWCFEVEVDAKGNYPDEPIKEEVTDPDDYGYTSKIYTIDQPETPHLVYEWRAVLDQYWREHGGEERILMVETWSPLNTVMDYYGNSTADGGQIPFNFQLILNLNAESNATQYAAAINTWLDNMPDGKTPNWVIGSHDKNRVSSRFTSERIDLFNILLLTLPGCSITYNGEEIGMHDVWISWNKTVDPQACNGPKDGYEYRSRDPARTPMQWSDELNAGFSDGNKTWLPIGDDYKTLNVKRQRGISQSYLNVFKELQVLREGRVFKNGDTEIKAVNDNVLAVKRYLKDDYTYIVLLNVFDKIKNFNLHKTFNDLPEEFIYALVTQHSLRRKGNSVRTRSITLLPYETVILRSAEKATK